MPRWAQLERSRRWLTRRRLALAAGGLVLLFLIAWANYPLLPNPKVLLFNRPSTSLSSQSHSGEWAMAGGTVGQSRDVIPTNRTPRGRLSWSRDLGQPTLSTPVVVDGVIYIGGYFKLLALDAASGEARWEVPTSGPVNTSVAVAGDLLYVGLLDRRLVALDRATGDLRWEFTAEDIVLAAPVAHRGIVYFGSADGRMYARDAATGEKIWTYETTGWLRRSLSLEDGVLAVADDNGKLHLLNARTGQNRLVYRTPRAASAAPVTANNLVYYPAGGVVYAVDGKAKEIPWQFQFKAVWTQFWLWQVPGVPRPPAQQGGAWIFSPEGNASTVIAGPAVTSSLLYAGDLGGILHALDANTGQEQWQFQAQGRIYAAPVVAGDRVYFGTDAGDLYALEGSGGRQVWRVNLGAPIRLAPSYAGGRLYVRTEDGRLHIVE